MNTLSFDQNLKPSSNFSNMLFFHCNGFSEEESYKDLSNWFSNYTYLDLCHLIEKNESIAEVVLPNIKVSLKNFTKESLTQIIIDSYFKLLTPQQAIETLYFLNFDFKYSVLTFLKDKQEIFVLVNTKDFDVNKKLTNRINQALGVFEA